MSSLHKFNLRSRKTKPDTQKAKPAPQKKKTNKREKPNPNPNLTQATSDGIDGTLLNPWLPAPEADNTAPGTSRATNKANSANSPTNNITSLAWEERFTSLEKLVKQQNTQLADIHKSLHLPLSTNNTQKPPTHSHRTS